MGRALLKVYVSLINSGYWYFLGLIFDQGVHVCFRVHKFLWLGIF